MNTQKIIGEINHSLSILEKNNVTEPIIIGYKKVIEVLINNIDVYDYELVKDIESVHSRAIVALAVDFVKKEISEKQLLSPLLAYNHK